MPREVDLLALFYLLSRINFIKTSLKPSPFLQDMFFHVTQRRHKIRGNTFVRNNQGLTPLTLAAKLGRKEMFHEILEHQSMVRNNFDSNSF